MYIASCKKKHVFFQTMFFSFSNWGGVCFLVPWRVSPGMLTKTLPRMRNVTLLGGETWPHLFLCEKEIFSTLVTLTVCLNCYPGKGLRIFRCISHVYIYRHSYINKIQYNCIIYICVVISIFCNITHIFLYTYSYIKYVSHIYIYM